MVSTASTTMSFGTISTTVSITSLPFQIRFSQLHRAHSIFGRAIKEKPQEDESYFRVHQFFFDSHERADFASLNTIYKKAIELDPTTKSKMGEIARLIEHFHGILSKMEPGDAIVNEELKREYVDIRVKLHSTYKQMRQDDFRQLTIATKRGISYDFVLAEVATFDYFHGLMTREEAEKILEPGQYLARVSSETGDVYLSYKKTEWGGGPSGNIIPVTKIVHAQLKNSYDQYDCIAGSSTCSRSSTLQGAIDGQVLFLEPCLRPGIKKKEEPKFFLPEL